MSTTLRHFAPERVIGLEEARFGGQIDIDRPLDAFIQKLGMRRRIEEAVEITRIVENTDVAVLGVGSHSIRGSRRAE